MAQWCSEHDSEVGFIAWTYWPFDCQAMTLAKLFTVMCIIWYG